MTEREVERVRMIIFCAILLFALLMSGEGKEVLYG